MGLVWQEWNERDARWNHGSYSNKSWVNKFMGGTIYVLGKCIQLASATQCFTPYVHNIPGHDEDLDAGRLSVLLKKQNGITFTVFNNIILFSYMDY
jgi:linoleoyl-CoA desaturase